MAFLGRHYFIVSHCLLGLILFYFILSSLPNFLSIRVRHTFQCLSTYVPRSLSDPRYKANFISNGMPKLHAPRVFLFRTQPTRYTVWFGLVVIRTAHYRHVLISYWWFHTLPPVSSDRTQFVNKYLF